MRTDRIVFGFAGVITQAGRVDVFAHGADNQLWQRFADMRRQVGARMSASIPARPPEYLIV